MTSIDAIELPLEEKVRRFFQVLREQSANKQDPISEWGYVYEEPNESGEQKYCICSTKIINLHVIQNKVSGVQLEIGSECIKKWKMAPVCKSCNGAIGSLTKRRKTNDWFCRKCKKAKEKETLAKQIEKQMLLERLGKQLFYGYYKASKTSPWYGKRFREVVDDPLLIKLTLQREEDHADYWAFREFLELYRSQTPTIR
jgi:ribosomal protein L37AE/L43A